MTGISGSVVDTRTFSWSLPDFVARIASLLASACSTRAWRSRAARSRAARCRGVLDSGASSSSLRKAST
jgi:hypothetical protein